MKCFKVKVLSVSFFVLAVCFAGNSAVAAIAFDNASSANSGADNSGTTLSFQHTIGGGSDRILIVGLACESDNQANMAISGVTYNGVAMDPVAGASETVGSTWYMKTDLYYLLDSDLPSAGTYTVTVTYAGSVLDRSGGAISLTGAAQYAREAAATNSNASHDTISTNITTLTDGAWVVDVVGCGNSGSFTTTTGGMTERWDTSAGSSSGAASTKAVASAGLTTMGWQHSTSANRLAHSVAAFAPAATSPYPLGDLNQDTAVDWTDVGLFCDQWLDSGCSGPNCADLDKQNGVNGVDFALMMQNWTGSPVPGQLVINEFMASNSNVIADEQGEYDDWIEIYNGTDSAVDIGGMYITDDLNEPNKYQIPDDAPGQTTIPAYGYLVLWADGETAEGKLHLPFQLSKSGEDVGLFEADGTTPVDGLSFGQQVGNVSFGRYPDAANDWRYMGIPTPGAANVDGYLGVVDEPEISHVHGFYDSPFEVELSCDDGDAEIRYTTDGSTPTDSHGTVYSSRISITTTTCLRAAAFKPGYKPSTVNTATYIFLDDVKTQSDSDAQARGFPWPNWVGNYTGTTPADYEMDPAILNDPCYSGRYSRAMKAIPTMSLVSDMQNWFDPQTGIYANPNQPHIDDGNPAHNWERPVSVEFFDPCTNEDFQINAGIRIVGENSKNTKNPKHSMRVWFKGEFGPSELVFPFYKNTEVTKFNNISLRSQYNGDWLDGNIRAQYLRDTFAQDSMRDMGWLSPDSRFVHLYINGLYWGLYQASERSDESFLSENLGDEPEQYDVIKGRYAGGGYGFVEYKSGEPNCWDTMMNMISGHDLDNPVDASEYSDIKQYLDVTEFCDYTMYNLFVSNWDWPAKNWMAASTRNPANADGPPAGKWQFYTWDAELSLFLHFQMNTPPFSGYTGPMGDLHCALQNNPDYNRLFGDQVHKMIFNDGELTEQRNVDRYEQRAEQIEDAIISEAARWGDYYHNYIDVNTPAFTPANWDYERDRMINPDHPTEPGGWAAWFPSKAAVAADQFRDRGLYPPASYPAPQFSQQGGEISAGGSVTVTGSGTIYYTTDGSEPLNYGMPISSGSSVTIEHSLVLKARADFGSGNWSALNEATFAVGDLVGDLRITEIMYHPHELLDTDPNDPNEEFIELRNIGGSTLNLNLVKLTEGVDFTFGDMALAAGDYVVIVKNQPAFMARYPGFSGVIAGEWTGPRGGVLSNAGERLRLEDAIGRTILDFSYKDGWRKVTDGDGFSLNIVDESADANLWADKANWAASKYTGGTPGYADTGLLAEHSVAINEVMAHTDVAPQDWIELKNTTSSPIDISGWYLSDSDEDLFKYQIAAGTTLGAGNYLVLTEDDNFGPNSIDPGKATGFGLSEYGETVELTSSDGGVLTGYREREDFGSSENGVSIGRYQKSTGAYNFVAMSSPTRGGANAAAKVGPVVINEIMYNPASGGQNEEYIELHNITGGVVNLYETIDSNVVGWKFTKGIKYTFGAVSIPAGSYLLVVKTDPVYFKTLYSVPGGVTVLGPYQGRLSNSGEKVELSKPGDVDEWGKQHYIRVDRVIYSDGVHPDNPWESDLWPKSPDAGGDSLNRTTASNYGNDIANWHAATPSPGAANN